ncbi:MAG: CsbD family protein [Pseudomonadota bacterium]|nr:CsbD family protein [Pseudomonadota bacterium]
MNRGTDNQVKGNWKQLKGKAQQTWGNLTDDELDVIEGKREELVGRLQAKYGYTKEKAEQEADSLESKAVIG